MFYSFDDKSVRLTGRWGIINNAVCATATGSYIEIAFHGNDAVLRFDTSFNQDPKPHLWIFVDSEDNGVEVAVDRLIRVQASEGRDHVVKVVLKSSVEVRNRWEGDLGCAVRFLGFDGQRAELTPDNRRTIEFLGDSITEGVFTDFDYVAELPHDAIDQLNRVYQDDVCATYAWQIAKALNLRPFFNAYGAVGITKGGNGGVPQASDCYDYNFKDSKKTYGHPDVIMIHHGTNDRRATTEDYLTGYEAYLNQIRAEHPDAVVIALSLFMGVRTEEFCAFIGDYNKKYNASVNLIDTHGWVPVEPHHPTREGHLVLRDHLVPMVKEIIG